MLRNLALFSLLAVLVCAGVTVFADSDRNDPKLGHANYVVIGAFEFVKNAEKFAVFAKQEKELPAKMAINPLRDLYYVYILESEDLEPALQLAEKIRAEHPDLWDTWTFTGSLGAIQEKSVTVAEINQSAQQIEESISSEPEESSTDDASVPEIIEEVKEETEIVDEPVEAEIDETVIEETEEVVEEEVAEEPSDVTIEPIPGHHYLYFNTVKKGSYKEVKGRVRVVDAIRHREMSMANSHEVVEVKNPNNGSDALTLQTQIFGFKEVSHTINLVNPLTDSTQNFTDVVGDSIILNFELERFSKGDILVMYNVYFYKDAAIMKPESKYELYSLLDMLQENEKLKVRIHGHTNGNARGKIVHLNKENPDFFSLKDAEREALGTAKELSFERASTIQQWLVSEGVSEDRMTVKGWGGKKMVYDKHDTQAHKNVRVEIEIVED